ncbi:hypothetical protein [Vibrio parahaemolyticus]|uniref:hypothetical protein n=1 Tax=Vibrio parahaemolyticus TaxID=670 RepID=UPI0004D828BA|nr:hypothetical protein [Vibrio parahaemolyticus]EHU4930382.1 hypothetical protein [Vibrio vulnificus]AVW95397.1 hypothetical protein DA442_09665 [Vibrio parahaemolyticus]EGQ8739640.1 hypothetical protein [Vibrio parahaemolyticus]EGQ8907644.1 hypothetical protein [Vibrio parahaemolyticus]EGR3101804.1 hypothetical protein [Vibrio parahaemolyticus]
MTSLQGILNLDASYPGIHIKVELIVLKEYLSHMESGVAASCNSYITSEEKSFNGLEHYEYSHIYRIAEDEIPRIIRMPMLVSIYTLFENSVTQLLEYTRKKEEKAVGLKDVTAKSLPSKCNKYIERVLGLDFAFDQKTMNALSEITKLRNCIAHANGNVGSLEASKANAIQEIAAKEKLIFLTSDQLDISYEYLRKSMDIVDASLRDLMAYIEEKYGFY